ncbi:hypothetical protein JCM6882_001186 [Rhodosporidiobolus microsporus]
MPATNGLQPPLSPAERKVLKSYGDWTSFCQSFGIKPWDPDAAEEGLAILRSFAADDEDGKGAKGKK